MRKLKRSCKKIPGILFIAAIAAIALFISRNFEGQLKTSSDITEPDQVQEKNNEISNNNVKTSGVPDSGYIDDEYSVMIRNGSVVVLDKHIEGNKFIQEVYNTANLDKFIDNFNSGKQDKIRIVKYNFESARVWINKLMDLECNNRELKLISYDVHSIDTSYKKVEEKTFAKITKEVVDGGIRYSVHESKDEPDNMGVTILSFSKSSLKK